MIHIDPAAGSVQDNYKLLIGSILPRPIALVTTLSDEGVLNAAPFSFFNIVSANPPMVAVSVQRKDGELKDTAKHAMNRGQFVVHIADESYIATINETAAPVASEVSEVELAGLTPIASSTIDVPGVQEARIRMECVLENAIPLGGQSGEPACELLIGRVTAFHVAEELYHEGRIDASKLRPVGRMAGNDYAKLGDTFTLIRPGT
jgi:flavin reductase (DIM6/NTAB) family NADH-FMN oxidoreductase RutF